MRGIKTLLQKPRYGLFWEMRLRKSATVINAACLLIEARELDVVVVACPAAVARVWCDRELGEIQAHAFIDILHFRYESRTEHLLEDVLPRGLFIVVSYEFLRQEDRTGSFTKVDALLGALKGKKFMLVCDEGSELGNYRAMQTKAILELAEPAERVVMLDGTPLHKGPLSQYSKFKIIDPKILGFKNYHHFAAVHAIKGGYKSKVVVGFRGQTEDVKVGPNSYRALDSKVKDHCEFLSRSDIKDMDWREPERSFLTVALSESTWKIYKQMRDEMIADLSSGRLAVQHATVRAMRLAQICSGFIGGVVTDGDTSITEELSSESTDFVLGWLADRFEEDPAFKVVLWCRWRAEIERMCKRLTGTGIPSGFIYGKGEINTEYLNPSHPYQGGLVLVAQPQAARYGRNFSKAATAVYLSRDYDATTAAQSEDRIQAPGQINLLLDILVTGPQGQKTITWDVRKTILGKTTTAMRTTAEWKIALEDN